MWHVSLGLPNNTGLDVVQIMAKVPCKEDIIFTNSSFRKAVSRYVRCYSQVSMPSKCNSGVLSLQIPSISGMF